MLQAIANSDICEIAIISEHWWLANVTVFHKIVSWINCYSL